MAVIPFASQYVLQQKSYHFLRKTPPSMERREGFYYCRERSLPVTWSIWSLVFVMSASCSRLPPGPKLHLNLSPHFCFLFMAVCKSLWCQKSKDGDNPIVLIQPPSDLNLSYLVASGHRVFFSSESPKLTMMPDVFMTLRMIHLAQNHWTVLVGGFSGDFPSKERTFVLELHRRILRRPLMREEVHLVLLKLDLYLEYSWEGRGEPQ